MPRKSISAFTDRSLPPCLIVRIALFISALVLLSASLQAQSRGLTVVPADASPAWSFTGAYALVIGESDYSKGWPKLPGVKDDISLVSAALERNGFTVIKGMNLDADALKRQFEDFINTYGLTETNRLVFYYAGHGHTLKLSGGRSSGYLVPVDAPSPLVDEAGFKRKAIPMQQIEVYAKQIEARHALFLFDSCFSGSLFNISRAIPENITAKSGLAIRQFITSGSADETVPDKSVFRAEFVNALSGSADRNKDGYVTGSELGEYLNEMVVNYTRRAQNPQYGKILDPSLDKGDFVFAVGAVQADVGKVVPVSPSTPQKPSAQVKPYEYDYQKNLMVGNFLVGNEETPLLALGVDTGYGWLDFEVDEGKGAELHFVDRGTAAFSNGWFVDHTAGEWKKTNNDLYYIDFAKRSYINVSNDRDLNREVFYDYAQSVKRVLYLRIPATGDAKELCAISLDARYERSLLKITDTVDAACWLDDRAERALIVLTGKDGKRTLKVWDSKVNSWTSIMGYNVAPGDYCDIIDVNYASGQILVREGTWEKNGMFLVKLSGGSRTELPDGGNLYGCLFNARGDMISYHANYRDDARTMEIGTYDLKTGKRYPAFQGSGLETVIFWIGPDRIGYIVRKGIKDPKPSGPYAISSFYTASSTGKGAAKSSLVSEDFYIWAEGQHFSVSYGKACPQVYVQGPGGSLVFIDEIVKNANDISKRTRETIAVPVTLMDRLKPRILISEKLRETGFLFDIRLSSDSGPVSFHFSGDALSANGSWTLSQGSSLWLEIDSLPAGLVNLFLSAEGFYMPN